MKNINVKNIVTSLYKIVQWQYQAVIKRFSTIESQYGTQLETFVFQNCSGQSVLALQMISVNLRKSFLKDLIKNEYVDMQRTILPQHQDMTLYGGKNQVYVGFSKIVYCTDVQLAIKQFKKYGYLELQKQNFNINIHA